MTEHLRGYKIEEHEDGTFFFSDDRTDTRIRRTKCGHCNLEDTPEGHDGCLGTLKGIMNACCGHGCTDEAYLQFLDSTTLHGEDACIVLEVLKRNKL